MNTAYAVYMRLYRAGANPSDTESEKRTGLLARPLSTLYQRGLIIFVLPVSLAPVASLAELITPVIGLADATTTTVVVDVAGAVRAHTATDTLIGVAASLAARGILPATLPAPAALTGSSILVPAAIAILAFAIALFSLATLANIRAALRVPTTRIT